MDTPPITPDPSLPPAIPPFAAPEDGESPSLCQKSVFFLADTQHYQPPYQPSVIRSFAVHVLGPPGNRLPGMEVGVSIATETLVRQGMESLGPCKKELLGTVFLGDALDVGSREEWAAFERTMKRLEGADPVAPNPLLAFTIGNHDIMPSGVFQSGRSYFGGTEIAFNLGNAWEFREKIYLPEIGGARNAVDKEWMVKTAYQAVYGKKAAPSLITPYLLETDALQNFWKEEDEGRWSAVIRFRPSFKRPRSEDLWTLDPSPVRLKYPEQEWLSLSAVRLGDFKSSAGSVPLYFLGLDTMDFLDVDPDKEPGTVKGQISSVQVKLVTAFMDRALSQNPSARFLIGGHYRIRDLAHVDDSGFRRLLESPSVLAYIGAHTHYADYTFIERKGLPSLPEITVPSITDFGPEMVDLKYGVEGDKVVLQFQFRRTDEGRIAGDSETVQKEVARLKPQLLVYDDILNHMFDPRVVAWADPHRAASLTDDDKRYLLSHVEDGLLFDLIHPQSRLLAHDIAPASVEKIQLYLRLASSTAKLALIETGIGREADDLDAAFLRFLTLLEGYYEQTYARLATIARKQLPNATGDKETIEKQLEAMGRLAANYPQDITLADINLASTEAAAQSNKTLAAIQKRRGENPSPLHQQLLSTAETILRIQYGFTAGPYRNQLQKHREDSSKVWERFNPEFFTFMRKMSGAMGVNFKDILPPPLRDPFTLDENFGALFRTLQEVPHGSHAGAFLTYVFLESIRQHNQFLKRVPPNLRVGAHRAVKIIRLEVDTRTGRVSITPPVPGGVSPDDEKKSLGVPPQDASWKNYRLSKPRRPERHLVARTGFSGFPHHDPFQGALKWDLAAGMTWHLRDEGSGPRITWNNLVDFSFGSFPDFSFSHQTELLWGDPWGWVGVGPFLKTGLTLPLFIPPPETSLPHLFKLSLGGHLEFFEGALFLQGGHQWRFPDGTVTPGDWYLGAGLSVVNLYAELNGTGKSRLVPSVVDYLGYQISGPD